MQKVKPPVQSTVWRLCLRIIISRSTLEKSEFSNCSYTDDTWNVLNMWSLVFCTLHLESYFQLTNTRSSIFFFYFLHKTDIPTLKLTFIYQQHKVSVSLGILNLTPRIIFPSPEISCLSPQNKTNNPNSNKWKNHWCLRVMFTSSTEFLSTEFLLAWNAYIWKIAVSPYFLFISTLSMFMPF